MEGGAVEVEAEIEGTMAIAQEKERDPEETEGMMIEIMAETENENEKTMDETESGNEITIEEEGGTNVTTEIHMGAGGEKGREEILVSGTSVNEIPETIGIQEVKESIETEIREEVKIEEESHLSEERRATGNVGVETLIGGDGTSAIDAKQPRRPHLILALLLLPLCRLSMQLLPSMATILLQPILSVTSKLMLLCNTTPTVKTRRPGDNNNSYPAP